MSKLGLLVICLVLSGFLSRAQAEDKNDVVIIKEMPEAIYENSSAHNRMGKTYQVTYMPIGVGPGNASWAGLNLGYSLSRNSSVIFSLNQINKFSRTCSGGIQCSISGQAVELSYKKFVANSFYYIGGLNYRKVDYSYKNDFGSMYDYDYSFNGNALSANFSIGNQWQWENFTLGCDWIGFALPIAHTIENESFTGSAVWGRSNFNDEKERLLENFSLRGLNFYLGASF